MDKKAWIGILGLGTTMLGGVACADSVRNPPIAHSEPDAICSRLYDTYIARQQKVSREITISACQIIAERGRSNGFWQVVLDGMKQSKDEVCEAEHVRILGLMLSVEADMRNIQASPGRAMMATEPITYLPSNVVPDLIERAKSTSKDWTRAAYVLALSRSRDAQTIGYLRSVMVHASDGTVNASMRFHAAVGLAQSGDTQGLEWLVSHSDSKDGDVVNALPEWVSGRSTASCCRSALQELSGKRDLQTKAEFESWWKTAARPWVPARWVVLRDW